MARNGLLIDYDYCTGCYSCSVACQQEHDYPAGTNGIKVTEFILPGVTTEVSVNYLPFPTDHCNLCPQLTRKGERPACVKHCQAACMMYGPVSELAKELEKKSKMVLFTPQ